MEAHAAVLLVQPPALVRHPLLLRLQPGVLAPQVAPEACGAPSSSTHLGKGKQKRGGREEEGEGKGRGKGKEIEKENKKGKGLSFIPLKNRPGRQPPPLFSQTQQNVWLIKANQLVTGFKGMQVMYISITSILKIQKKYKKYIKYIWSVILHSTS